MKDRDGHIAFARNYCQHYKPQGAKTICAAGCDIANIKRTQTRADSTVKWGPCIEGHLLPDVLTLCPKWERVTMEAAEKRADGIGRSLQKLITANPFISAWRKKEPRGKAEVVECPVCKGRLHLSQAAYNGHVWAKCATADCINFVE